MPSQLERDKFAGVRCRRSPPPPPSDRSPRAPDDGAHAAAADALAGDAFVIVLLGSPPRNGAQRLDYEPKNCPNAGTSAGMVWT